jgi:hypothetical protein
MNAKTLPLVLCLTAALPVTAASSDKILDFDTMVGVVRPFTGAANAIRGVPGGGIPWAIAEGRGKLRADGRIDVRVRGLVLAEGANAGTNPSPVFRAIVSCLTPMMDASGTLGVAAVNVATGTFPASPEGDSMISDVVQLPSPCIAPIVFVANANGSWFSATGF